MMIAKGVIAGLCVFALSGCYSMQGSERVLNKNGMLTAEVPQDTVFRADFEKAYTERLAGNSVDQIDVDAMLSSGFTHIYAFCDNYFDSMGLQQRKSQVTRDAIAPISALITGVIALHSFEKHPSRKEDILAVLGLATAATSSALDIYDEHMLFGAENIGSVETLTLNALNEHSARVLAFNNVSFDAAVRHLLKNQSICSPQHILSLTREAIKEGRVVARTSGDTTDANGLLQTDGTDSNKPVDVSIENR